MTLAATPPWFADNIAQISVVTLLVLTVLVLRMVQKAALRFTLLAVLAVLAVFVWANRAPLKACAQTCECSLVGQEITVPSCDPDVSL